MSWFPVLAALGIVVVTYFGIDHPSRAIGLQVSIALIALLGLGLDWWKTSQKSEVTLPEQSNKAA